MIRLLPFDDFNQSSEAMLPLTRLWVKLQWPDSRMAPNLQIETLLDDDFCFKVWNEVQWSNTFHFMSLRNLNTRLSYNNEILLRFLNSRLIPRNDWIMCEMKQTNQLDAGNKMIFIWPKNNVSMIKNKVFWKMKVWNDFLIRIYEGVWKLVIHTIT